MARVRTIPKSTYRRIGQLLFWATATHYVLLLTGAVRRHKRTETMLPQLVKEGRLIAVRYGKKLAYTVPRKYKSQRPNIEHGIGCSDGLVRFLCARPDVDVVPQGEFRGLGSAPEFGILFPKGALMLYEFETLGDFYQASRMKTKVSKYRRNLSGIEQKFAAELRREVRVLVVFVVDAPREAVQRFVGRVGQTGDPFYFTDYATFKAVEIGRQLVAPIYIWGKDGKSYPLVEGDG